ncbi:MAG: amino acid adenylation domain-containing protein, partial [Methylococcales bacterium]|nr:amino acid adenylation domain-containing protein [Methylococcales bacterium]
TSAGLLREVVVEPGRAYFDTNLASHHHFFFEDSGQIEDIPDNQVLFVVDVGKAKPQMSIEYHQSMFEDHHFLERMIQLSEQMINADKIVATMADISLLTESEQSQIKHWNDTSKTVDLSHNVVKMIEQQVTATPDAIAVQCGDKQLSYLQLNTQANQLAHILIEQGVKTDQCVGICLNRQVEVIVSILAVIKAGGAYLPIDPNYPQQRISFMLENSTASLLISNTMIDIELPETIQHITLENLDLSGQVSSNPDVELNPNQMIYVIYTSGSTGQPKGAAVEHHGVTNLLTWYTSQFNMTSEDNALIISSIGFDLTQKNLFALLTVGGTVIFPETDDYDDQLINQLIDKNKITLLNCAPSAFYPLVELLELNHADFTALQSLRRLFLGGEPIALSRLQNWLDSDVCHCTVVNSYGPTECTDIAAYFEITQNSDYYHQTIPIGTPNHNVCLYVLDAQLNHTPVGVAGELCISGLGVGRGYIGDEALTDDKFINNLFDDQYDSKLYRTGDIVRYNQNGDLEFIGRIDHQVKIRGLRIELGEIESALTQQENVDDSLVIVQDDKIIAYCLSKEKTIDNSSLKQSLAKYLPDYMIPSVFVLLDSWPLTPNGKIDRKALPAPEIAQIEYEAPQSDTEITLSQIWSQLLGVQHIGRQDNFFDLGGHSLLATQLISQVRKQFEIELPVRSLFEVDSLQSFATVIDDLIQ